MKLKSLVLGLSAVTLVAASASAFASGINITNKTGNTIQVKCAKVGVPIGTGSPLALPWSAVELILGGSTGKCTFSNSSGTIGTANLSISGNEGKITSYTTANGYAVTGFTKNQNYSTLNATIQKA